MVNEEETPLKCRYFHLVFGISSILLGILMLTVTFFVNRPIYMGVVISLCILVSGVLAMIGAWKRNRNCIIGALGIDCTCLTSVFCFIFVRDITIALSESITGSKSEDKSTIHWVFVCLLVVIGVWFLIHTAISGIQIGLEECNRRPPVVNTTAAQPQVLSIQYAPGQLPGQGQVPIIVEYPNYQYSAVNSCNTATPGALIDESPPPYSPPPYSPTEQKFMA